MPDTSHITDYLSYNAQKFPSKPAVIFEDTTLTWQQLHLLVTATAAAIAGEVENESQQIIGLLLPNGTDFLVTYLAIVHAGHICMPLDPNFKTLEVTSVVEQMKPSLCLTNEYYRSFFPESANVKLATDLISNKSSVAPKQYLRLAAEEQVASMLFTSGTTGNPKSTPYTHRNHMWNIQAVSKLWKWSHEDTILLSLPLSHWHGLVMGVDGALYHGNTINLHERFEPEATLEALSTGKISLFMHVPIAYLLMTQLKTTQSYDLSKVRLCVSGSSYLPPAVWQQFKQMYGQEILERYGASEMGLLASNTLDSRVPGIVGKPLSGVDIRIEKDGQIAMRSPGLFPGYHNNDEATRKNTTPDGWWLSGDIGEFDNDGNLKLKGRIQEKIKKYGYTIYPRDVEWALLKNTNVKDVVVVGIQNAGRDLMSDQMVYFVVGDISEQDVNDYCKAHMPSFWRPDKVVIMEAIPKSRAGKPKIAELRASVED